MESMDLPAESDDAAPRFHIQVPQVGDVLSEEIVYDALLQVAIGGFGIGRREDHDGVLLTCDIRKTEKRSALKKSGIKPSNYCSLRARRPCSGQNPAWQLQFLSNPKR
jgi:hypothetical protein